MRLNFYTGMISMGNPEVETDRATWVPLVLAVMPRKTFRKVGYIYKAFAYGEDLNFCLRVRKAGLRDERTWISRSSIIIITRQFSEISLSMGI
jgi:GT2 family glycosyltransferase